MATTRAARPTPAARMKRGAHARLGEAMAWLQSHATARTRTGLTRYGIVTADRVLGVSMADTRRLGKLLGRDHALADALWRTAVFDARMLAAFVAEPAKVTPAQMDRWCRDFDNWAYCDTLSFHLFDRTPHAWAKVDAWSRGRGEFVKRTAFALLWSLALHDKTAGDAPFLGALRLIEREAADDRHFVRKAVNMALRAVGRRGPAVRAEAVRVARRLAASDAPAPRWIGRDALKTLAKGRPQ
jgi:3-methyladenine DNA glycosylase AlkD